VDAIEDIDYSICTLEFEVRRESYYWLLESLEMYRPKVYEMSRLDITHTFMSKRKIKALVMEGTLRGWDDPRLSTLAGLRRRGYTAEAIKMFCREIGVTRNQTTIQMSRLEGCLRRTFEEGAARAMAVLDPLKVVLTNYVSESKDGDTDWVEVPNHPQYPEMGTHRVARASTVYIERSDFRAEDDSDYFGLAPGKSAYLRFFGPAVTCTGFEANADGTVTEVRCEIDYPRAIKPKGVIHWAAEGPTGEVRIYEHLFTAEEVSDDWRNELNPNSEKVYPNAMIDASLTEAAKTKPAGTPFQFERQG
jgi:glutaminyl-tRNA synthetase